MNELAVAAGLCIIATILISAIFKPKPPPDESPPPAREVDAFDERLLEQKMSEWEDVVGNMSAYTETQRTAAQEYARRLEGEIRDLRRRTG